MAASGNICSRKDTSASTPNLGPTWPIPHPFVDLADKDRHRQFADASRLPYRLGGLCVIPPMTVQKRIYAFDFSKLLLYIHILENHKFQRLLKQRFLLKQYWLLIKRLAY
jgi:hypothetical protein